MLVSDGLLVQAMLLLVMRSKSGCTGTRLTGMLQARTKPLHHSRLTGDLLCCWWSLLQRTQRSGQQQSSPGQSVAQETH